MTDHQPISAETAREMLDHADRISRRAHDAVRWPYIAFILALGVATSAGTFGMSATAGTRSFGAVYFGLLATVLALVVFFCITIRGRVAFAWSRRWAVYIAAWTIAYGIALTTGILLQGTLLWPAVTSALVFAVTLTCAAVEARR